MGKKAPSAPPAPDPYATARAQTSSNVSTAIANSIMGNANETSPLGSVNYGQSGSYKMSEPVLDQFGNPTGRYTEREIPIFTRNTTLSPEQQALYDRQTGVQTNLLDLATSQSERLRDTLANPLNFDGLPAARNTISSANLQNYGAAPTLNGQIANVGEQARTFGDAGTIQTGFADVGGPHRTVGPTDFSADRLRVEQAMHDRLNPQLERDRAALETQLVNQGFTRGTEAFRTQMDQSDRAANDARLAIIGAGGQEQSRLAGLEFQRFGLENQAQQQAYEQARGRGEFANTAQAQQYEQMLGRGQFANDAQKAAFDQALARSTFSNATDQANFDNRNSVISANNGVEQQRVANDLQSATFANTARERALQERMAERNAPINEISALLGQSQVQMPQFTPFQSGQVAGTPVGDYVYRSADINQKNAQIAAQQSASTSGGLFGLGSALLGGVFKSPLLLGGR